MNQTFDMRLDIKPPAQRPNKPAGNRTGKPSSDSNFKKTLKDVTASKQPDASVTPQKPTNSKVENEVDVATGIPQEDMVDLQNAAAIMAATIMPTILIPDQMEVQTDASAEVSQLITETLVGSDVQQTAVQTDVQQTVELPKMAQETSEMWQPVQEQTTEQPTMSVESQKSELSTNTTQTRTEQKPVVIQEGQDKSVVVTEAGAAAQSARPLFEHVEATPIQVADPVPVDTPDFPVQLTKQINTAVAEGANTIEVQLTPHELGKIKIRLTMTEDGMQISMHSESSKTARLLSEHAANIGALVEHNQPGTVSVSVEHEQPNTQQHNQNAQHEQQGNGQQQHNQGNRHTQSQNEDFIQQLRLGLAGLS